MSQAIWAALSYEGTAFSGVLQNTRNVVTDSRPKYEEPIEVAVRCYDILISSTW
jgi:hypothetical protein